MRNALWIIIAIILIGGGYWWWSMSGNTTADTAVDQGAASQAPITTTPSDTVTTTPAAPMAVTVIFDGTAFSPAAVTVKQGGTVTFKNSSDKNMWVASDEHPTHTRYDDTSRTTHCAAGYTGETPFDQCKGDGDYSFIFNKVGAIEYHDHLNSSAHGVVTVVK